MHGAWKTNGSNNTLVVPAKSTVELHHLQGRGLINSLDISLVRPYLGCCMQLWTNPLLSARHTFSRGHQDGSHCPVGRGWWTRAWSREQYSSTLEFLAAALYADREVTGEQDQPCMGRMWKAIWRSWNRGSRLHVRNKGFPMRTAQQGSRLHLLWCILLRNWSSCTLSQFCLGNLSRVRSDWHVPSWSYLHAWVKCAMSSYGLWAIMPPTAPCSVVTFLVLCKIVRESNAGLSEVESFLFTNSQTQWICWPLLIPYKCSSFLF